MDRCAPICHASCPTVLAIRKALQHGVGVRNESGCSMVDVRWQWRVWSGESSAIHSAEWLARPTKTGGWCFGKMWAVKKVRQHSNEVWKGLHAVLLLGSSHC